MEITQIGLVVIPLCLLLCTRPERVLELTLVCGVFGAAAVIVVGGLGIQPSLFPALVFVCLVGLQILLGVRFPAAQAIWQSARPFAILTVFALVTSVVMPRLFSGQVDIWPQKIALSFLGVEPLEPQSSNFNQDGYLVVDCMVLIACALFSTRSSTNIGRLMGAYFLGAWIVVFLSFWQLASKFSGVFYPEKFLYSNPGWIIWAGQELGNVPRVNGPFAEPASLASYMAGVIYACCWLLLRGHRTRMVTWLLPVAVLTMLLSTSTTGFAALAAGLAMLLVYSVTRAPRRMVARIWRAALPISAGALLLGCAVMVVAPNIVTSAASVIDATLNKEDSSSYEDRTTADTDSLALVLQTGGLGVGWGSNRSSSLIPGLLSNLGIVGMALVLWFVRALITQVGQARRVVRDREQAMLLDAFLMSVFGQVVAAIISAPTIGSADFFAQLGILIGCSARIGAMSLRHRQSAQAAPLALAELTAENLVLAAQAV